MNEKEITERLIAIHSALTEKLGDQPYLDPALSIRQMGVCSICLYRADRCETLHTARSVTINGAFENAEAYIAAMPDLDNRKLQEFHGKLGRLIDEGREIDAPAPVMAKLTGGMEILSENLLTYEAAE